MKLSEIPTLGQFLLKSREKLRQRWLNSNSRSSTRARSAADCATEESRLDTEYWRSMRSAVFLVSNSSCSNPLLAVRHTSLHVSPEVTRRAKPSKSLRLKACTVATRRIGMYCLWVIWLKRCILEGRRGCHGRLVAMTVEGDKLADAFRLQLVWVWVWVWDGRLEKFCVTSPPCCDLHSCFSGHKRLGIFLFLTRQCLRAQSLWTFSSLNFDLSFQHYWAIGPQLFCLHTFFF